MDSSLNVALPTYFNNASNINYFNGIDSDIDKVWRSGIQSGFLVNNGSLPASDGFGMNRTMSIWNWSIHQGQRYDEFSDRPLQDPKRINSERLDFRITETLAFNSYADALSQLHNATLKDVMAWAAYNIMQAINPATDNNVFGNLNAHITANSYTNDWNYHRTDDAKARESIYQAFVASCTALKNRTDLAANNLKFVTTPQGIQDLKTDAKFVRDNEVSQKQVINDGRVGTVDGVAVHEVSADRFGTTHHSLLVDKSVVTFANPYKKLRYITDMEGRHGGKVDFLVFFDTLIAPNRGAASQGILHKTPT